MPIEFYSGEYPVSEVELVYKSKVKASERPRITKSQEVYAIFIALWDKNKIEFVEEFKVVFLNQANCVLALCSISSGGLTGTVADLRIVFGAALKLNACAIAICHNHPSGNLKPSKVDEDLTLLFSEAGRLLNIRLIDHLIITNEGYYSFADQGAL